MVKKTSGWDDEANEVQSNWVKFNVPMDDKIFGTLISKRQVKSQLPGHENEDVWIYEMKADEGSFHDVDEKKKIIEEPVVIKAGDVWNVGGKATIDVQMRNIKVGQKIGFKFLDEKPSKNKAFNPAKNIKVYAPKNDDGSPLMDEEFLASRVNPDDEFDNFGKTK